MDHLRVLISRFFHTYTYNIILDSWGLFKNLWIYLLIGIFFTALFQAFLDKQKLSEWVRRNSHVSIFGAAVFGVISPLGTYICLPMAGSLYRKGTPLAPLMAFLIASPILNPTIFMLTVGAFSYEMAFVRLFTGILLGVLGGYLFMYLDSRVGKISMEETVFPDKKRVEIKRTLLQRFLKEFKGSTLYMLKYFSIAIVIAAAIKNLVSSDQVEWILGRGSVMSVVFAAGAGIPLYSCGGAAIPVLYQLSELGMSKGAVLAFFISGPSTRVSNLVILKSVFNLRILIFYLGLVLAGSVLSGLIYNLFP